MNKDYINELSKEIYQNNVKMGWWDNNPCIFTKLQLVNTEISEATEGERKDLMDDHLPNRKMGEVELADALIRVLDIGGKLGIQYSNETNYFDDFIRWFDDSPSIGKQHLILTLYVTVLSICYKRNDSHHPVNKAYSSLINGIIKVSDNQGYDIKNAMFEKLVYNQKRLDHKRSNRAEKHGKKF